MLVRGSVALVVLLLVARMPADARALPPIVYVPMDDRPVTRQLPLLLGEIAGAEIIEPPRRLLGNYLTPGEPDRIIAWLNAVAARHARRFVLSSDMLAYGGLVASRAPGVSYADGYFRLRVLKRLRERLPRARIAIFGTVMRQAPTGVPASVPYFAAYPGWLYLQRYANLPEPPPPEERATVEALKAKIGTPLLEEYLAARARDRQADRLLLAMTADGIVDRLVLGQDDAGPVGLARADRVQLEATIAELGVQDRAVIQPGTDELGMVLVARMLARAVGWSPAIEVRYMPASGAPMQDPLEFRPIPETIENLIELCGGREVARDGEIVLFVRLPRSTVVSDDSLVREMRGVIARGRSVALVDETFLSGTYDDEERFAERILRDGIASHLDAYASWNTDANSVGTALAEAVAAGAGKRAGTYDALAHRTFTFMRFLDDIWFHAEVRPALERTLDAEGIRDHTYLTPAQAAPLQRLDRAWLWSYAQRVLDELYPGYHIAAMRITLPWDRPFETEIETAIAPPLPH
jgi:hypothetical protein